MAGLLIHGRGRTADEMMALARRIDIDTARWAAPQAHGGEWYPHRFTEPLEANEPFVSDAVMQCDVALRDVSEQGVIPRERTIVIGFSQGACLASEYVRRHPDRCGTLIMFTGGLIGRNDRDWRPAHGTLAGLNVLITGSDGDEWVSERRVREAAEVLARCGADVRLRIVSRRGHMVSDEEVAEARNLIEQGVYGVRIPSQGRGRRA